MPSIPSEESLHIVMAASEVVPYAKTGGLADVVGSLPQELIKLGHRVTVVLPGHRGFFTDHRRPHRPAMRLHVPRLGSPTEVTLEEESVKVTEDYDPLRVLAVRYDPYFDRSGLYQDERGDYPDNLERFTFLSRAVIGAVRHLVNVSGEMVHILHLHDWQTALCAVYLNAMAKERQGLGYLKTLLTLHNVGYQGIFPGKQFSIMGLPSALFSPSGLEFYGSVNCLKGGILFADTVSTVSPTYAKEIRTRDFGCGLEGVLANRVDGVQGITNGIDITVWNPESDSYLPAHYTASDLSGKEACKKALQRELNLPNRDVPLVAVIGRLTPQKGFDLINEIIPELMTMDIQMAILGAGDRQLEEEFLAIKSRYPDRIGLCIGFDEGLAHRIEAGADMLVMPSRYEPCGLSQLYSLRYGTVPIVRRTGGLADTVVPFRPSTAQAKLATGFHFMDASPDALLSAILLSLSVFRERDAWRSLQLAGMRTDVSWAQATKKYLRLYRSIIKTTEGKEKPKES